VTFAAVDNLSGVQSYDVRYQRGPTARRGFGAWVYPRGWQGTPAHSRVLNGMRSGYTYCFAVRARDRAGNVTPWSTPFCTSRVLDDSALTPSRGWTRAKSQPGFYAGTYARTTKWHASLSRSGTYTRIGVIAMHCPSCGQVAVYAGGKLIKRLNLKSSRAHAGPQAWVSAPMPRRTGVVTLRVVSHGKSVVIDALGLAL
jgi:hypothetical protein